MQDSQQPMVSRDGDPVKPPTKDRMFDLDSLKGKLDDETLAKLRAHVDDLSTKAETAEEKARKAAKESIEGRKGKDARIARMAELLGVEPDADLDALPDPKGQADAVKQHEAKIRRLERENAEFQRARDEAMGQIKTMRRDQSLAQALEGHRFKNPSDVRVLLQSRVVEEGDELYFKTDDGKTVSLKDGAAWFAKTRPDYVEASDAGGSGSGFKGSGGGGGGGAKGDLGGDKSARVAAISQRFPDLAKA